MIDKQRVPEFIRDQLALSGACPRGAVITVYGSGTPGGDPHTVCNSAGNFALPITVSGPDGLFTLVVEAVGASGAVSKDSVSTTKDSLPPVIGGVIVSLRSGTQVTVSGLCETGHLVRLNGDVAAEATAACADGVFSTALQFKGGDGLKRIDAAQADRAGNLGVGSVQYLLDTTSPALTVAAPVENASVGSSAAFAGQCENGLPVEFSGSGTAGNQSASCTAGQYNSQITLSAGDGSKKVSVGQTDLSGNQTVKIVTVNKITPAAAPPAVTIVEPAVGTVVSSQMRVSGTCVTGLIVRISGTGVKAQSTVACASGLYSAPNLDLSDGDGPKIFTVSQTDANNLTGSLSRSVQRDSTPPNLTIAAPAADAWVPAAVSMSGNCEAGLPLTFSGLGLAQSQSANCGAGTYSITINFSAGDGNKALSVSQADAAGNLSAVSRTFRRDTAAPSVKILQPAAGTAAESGLTVTGSCESGITVLIDGSGAASAIQTACNNQTFSTAVVFSGGDGDKSLTASQTDPAGNKSSDSRTFRRMSATAAGDVLYATHCAGCHGALASSTKKNRTAAQISGAIGSVTSMSSLAALSAAEVNAIAAALMDTTPAPETGVTALLRLGAREYSASALESVFHDPSVSSAENSSVLSIARDLVRNQPTSFGGVCRRYDGEALCDNAKPQYFAADPAATASRSGYMVRACEETLALNSAVATALKKAGGLTVAAPASDSNLSAVAELFYPGRSLPADVVGALRSVHQGALQAGQTTTDAWRFVMLPLCKGGALEILPETAAPLAIYSRCFAQLTGLRLSPGDATAAQVKSGSITPQAACMNLLNKGVLSGTTIANSNDAIARAVIKTMHNLHSSWFQMQDFSYVGNYAGHTGQMDLWDSSTPALYYTKALLAAAPSYRSVVNGSEILQAVRTNMAPARSPQSAVAKTDFAFTTAIDFPPNGPIIGVRSVAPASIGFKRITDSETIEGTAPRYATAGGGLLGNYTYLLLNVRQVQEFSADGAVNVTRRWGKAVLNDVLCRSLPLVRQEDGSAFVDSSSAAAPFRRSGSCVHCHATVDRLSGVTRGAHYLNFGGWFDAGQRGADFISIRTPTKPAETIWPSSADRDYSSRPPNGVLYLRSYSGALVNQPLTGVADLGQRLSELDDFYLCAAKRYYEYFTGISIFNGDLGDSSAPALSSSALSHRNTVIGLAQRLRTHDNLRTLISEILNLPAYSDAAHGSGN